MMIDILLGMVVGAIGFFGGVVLYLWINEPGIYTRRDDR